MHFAIMLLIPDWTKNIVLQSKMYIIFSISQFYFIFISKVHFSYEFVVKSEVFTMIIVYYKYKICRMLSIFQKKRKSVWLCFTKSVYCSIHLLNIPNYNNAKWLHRSVRKHFGKTILKYFLRHVSEAMIESMSMITL